MRRLLFSVNLLSREASSTNSSALNLIFARSLTDTAGFRFSLRFEDDAHVSVQHARDSAQHAERMTFVTGRFEPADLLLGCSDFAGELFLREARLFPECSEL